MTLQADLTAELDVSAAAGTLLSALSGPMLELAGIDIPVDPDRLAAIGDAAGSLDTSDLRSAVSSVGSLAQSVAVSLPAPDAVLGDLPATIGRLGSLADRDFASTLRSFAEDLGASFQGEAGEPTVALLLRLVDALSTAGGGVVPELLRAIPGAGSSLGRSAPLGDALPALDHSVRALGGMMALESVLAEAERLITAMGAALDPAGLRTELEAVASMLEGARGTTLAAAVAAVDPRDPLTVAAASAAVGDAAARLAAVRDQIATAFGLGEGTLVYLDLERVTAEVQGAAAMVRTADPAPLGRLVRLLATGLAPVITVDLAGVPRRGLEALVSEVEGRLVELASRVESFQPDDLVQPLVQGLAAVRDAVGAVRSLTDEGLARFQTAMESVRSAVAALPLDDVAEQIRRFLEPVAEMVRVVAALIQELEGAIRTGGSTALRAIGTVEGALASFKAEIDAAFAGARGVIEDADLDGVVGSIGDNIRAYLDVLGQAEMKPYFDTAVAAIGGTADVIASVPLHLLPDSMKADLAEAVRPIRETDADAVENQIEALLGIEPGGTFALRDEIEAALAGIQQRFDELMVAIRQADPRVVLADVEAELAAVAQRIRDLEPALTLQPVREAVDRVKDLVRAADPDVLLDPLREGFDRILAAVDAYSPAALVAPLEQELDRAREGLLEAVRFEQWAGALDDVQARALGLLDRFEPARAEDALVAALAEVRALVAAFPGASSQASLGAAVAGLLRGAGLAVAPASLEEVLRWLGGASGSAHLSGRTARIAEVLRRTRDGVDAVEVESIGARIATQARALHAAVRNLADRLPPGEAEGGRLRATLPRLQAGSSFGALALNRSRYLQRLERAVAQSDALRRTGFSEVDVAAGGIRAAVAPLAPARDFLLQLQDIAGLGGPQGRGMAGVLADALDAVPPERLVALVMPLFRALRGRLEALLTGVLAPVREAVADVRAIVDALDLTPLREAIDGIVGALREQILRLHPDQVLRAPLDAYAAFRAALLDEDPLALLEAVLGQLRDRIAGILDRLDLDALLESPLAIYDEIVAALGALNLPDLLAPVLDRLDTLAAQVDEGLDATVVSFRQLQAALPAGGGGSSASGSVSLG